MVRAVTLSQILHLDPSEPGFLEDPYPALNRLRESARVFYDPGLERWFVTRHEDVRACLRDKRLGRNFRHVLTPEEIGVPPLDPRWEAFWQSERWSLLWLEPPDHTRIRKLVAAAFTPRSVEALREPARELAAELLAPLAEAGEMELLYDYAQPYSIAVICRMLGVPLDRHRDLLDWSHRMVKMYEFDVPLEAAQAANRAAAEFQDYVRGLSSRPAWMRYGATGRAFSSSRSRAGPARSSSGGSRDCGSHGAEASPDHTGSSTGTSEGGSRSGPRPSLRAIPGRRTAAAEAVSVPLSSQKTGRMPPLPATAPAAAGPATWPTRLPVSRIARAVARAYEGTSWTTIVIDSG